MALYQKKVTSTGENVGSPGDIPRCLRGASDAVLAALEDYFDAGGLQELGLNDISFVPVVSVTSVEVDTILAVLTGSGSLSENQANELIEEMLG